MKKFRRFFLLLLMFVLVILSGCASGDAHLTLNPDGSIDYKYEVAMPESDEQLLDNPDINPLIIHELTAHTEGYKVERFRDKGFWGIRATKHFNNVSELKQSVFFKQYLSNKDEDFITYNDLFLFKSVRVNLVYDFQKTLYPITDQTDPILRSNFEKIKIKFTLTLPKQAVTNGVATQTPNTYEWILSPTAPTTVNAQYYSVHWIVPIALAGFIIFLFWLLWRKKKY